MTYAELVEYVAAALREASPIYDESVIARIVLDALRDREEVVAFGGGGGVGLGEVFQHMTLTHNVGDHPWTEEFPLYRIRPIETADWPTVADALSGDEHRQQKLEARLERGERALELLRTIWDDDDGSWFHHVADLLAEEGRP